MSLKNPTGWGKQQTGLFENPIWFSARRRFWNVKYITVSPVTAANKAALFMNATLSDKVEMQSKLFEDTQFLSEISYI